MSDHDEITESDIKDKEPDIKPDMEPEAADDKRADWLAEINYNPNPLLDE